MMITGNQKKILVIYINYDYLQSKLLVSYG